MQALANQILKRQLKGLLTAFPDSANTVPFFPNGGRNPWYRVVCAYDQGSLSWRDQGLLTRAIFFIGNVSRWLISSARPWYPHPWNLPTPKHEIVVPSPGGINDERMEKLPPRPHEYTLLDILAYSINFFKVFSSVSVKKLKTARQGKAR